MKEDSKNTTILYKKKNANKSPLLDIYIQKQHQQTNFESVEEQDIAKAIRTLLYKDDSAPRNLN